MRLRGLVGLAVCCGLVPAAHAQDGEPPADAALPDLELLEYLGSWQADDDEAWAIAEWEKDSAADRERERPRRNRGNKDDDTDDVDEDRDDEDVE